MTAPVIGLLGKLPAHGDFVRRGGPAAVLASLDDWLNAELTRAPALVERVDELDGWRFAVEQDGQSLLGVLVASEDSVGRRFPLLGVRTGAPSDAEAAETWCAAAASALASARDAGLRADAAMTGLSAIAEPAEEAGEPMEGWWRGERRLTRAQLVTGADFMALFDEAVS